MATIKFRLRTKTENSPIYVRFSISRNQVFETKSGFTINSNKWSFENAKPKQGNAENKILQTKLNDLENYILKQYNNDLPTGIVFTTEWLKNTIDAHFGRNTKPEEENTDLFSVYLNDFIELRKIDDRTKASTDRKFIQLQTKFSDYEKTMKKKFLISEIDKKFLLNFRNFLLKKHNYMESSANARLRNMKTVLLDARNNGKAVNHQINNFKIENISSIKVFLNFDEIQQIKDSKIIGSDLNTAKDWLIIGCYTGQRVSDLLRMTKEMISTKTDSEGNQFKILELKQEKTGKEVSIPLHDEVEAILAKYNGNFPHIFGKTKDSNFVLFNRYIKKVCQLAGITNIVKGKIFNDELKKNEIIETEKHNLITSHICRRSFATNFYGDSRFTTPQIMAITGHKTESVFLSYIGKTSSDHALQTARTFRQMAEDKRQTF